jgi:hypothetical protein
MKLKPNAAYRLGCSETNLQVANIEQRGHEAIVVDLPPRCGTGTKTPKSASF